MILFNTTNQAVLKVMLSEWEKVSYFVKKNEDKVDRYFRTLRPGATNYLIMHYTIPSSNNTYTIVSKPNYEGIINTWCYLKADGDFGKRKIFVLRKNAPNKEDLVEKPAFILDIYTGHFLSRYRERANATGSNIDELFVQFLQQNSRNGMAIPASLVNPKVTDENQYAVVSDEGLSFIDSTECTVNGMLIHINENKTFVSKDDLFYKQAASVLSTDFFIKKAKLMKAQEEGASAETFMKIMDSGFFEPVKK